MRSHFEQIDIDAIATKAVELRKPYLAAKKYESKGKDFFVCGPLRTSRATSEWVNEQTHLRAITRYRPHNQTSRNKTDRVTVGNWFQTEAAYHDVDKGWVRFARRTLERGEGESGSNSHR